MKEIARAKDFTVTDVYHPDREPGYAAWIGFFPGKNGAWYISFEETSKPPNPLPRMTDDEWYSYSYPAGYDKSPYLMEMAIAESRDGLRTWEVISRTPCRYHHSPESYAQMRTADGRFLRFVSEYARLGDDVHPGQVCYRSQDQGKTWVRQPPLHDRRVFSKPQRVKILRDGTMVLAIALFPVYGPDLPRACTYLSGKAPHRIRMCVCWSRDVGRTWSAFVPIFDGQNVTETDFVELASGDLLFINSSLWAVPGRQILYRMDDTFVPSLFERSSTPELVPETVCLADAGLLVGCIRGGGYRVSDDFGVSWQRLEGIPYGNIERHVYQPQIQYLGGGRVACAGHYGGDDPIESKEWENYIMVHTFEIDVLNRREEVTIGVHRDYDQSAARWPNSYTVVLDCGGKPIKDREIEFWYAEKFHPDDFPDSTYGDAKKSKLWGPGSHKSPPEYNYFGRYTVDQMMRLGGTTITGVTDERGTAHIALPHLDTIGYIHHSIKFVVSFNQDGTYPKYRPAQTNVCEFYSVMHR